MQVGERFPIEEVGLSAGESPAVAYFNPQAGTDGCTLEAGANREFRYLVNQDVGCLDVTQSVGLIPPGRAPTHSHSYDEIVYIIDGEGILHLGGQERVIGPGSAMHLPPLAEHCLENTGKGSMRVLGVFHPSGEPASRAYESE